MTVPGKKASKQFSSSKTAMASDEDLQIYCQPCDEEGTRLPAHGYCTDCKEHLCQTCFTAHKINRLSKQHTLLDATGMPKVLQQPSTSIHTGLSDDLTLPCRNISGDIIDSKEYQVILNAVNTTSDTFKQILKDVKDMTHKSNSSLKDALVDIKTFRQEINQRLDELERQAEDAAKGIKQENKKHLKAVETTCEEVTRSLKISSDKIKQLNTTKQADKLFIDLKLAEKTLKDMDGKLLTLSSFDIKEHNFQSNDVILNLFKTKKSLGTLTQKAFNKECQSVQVKSRHFPCQGEICVMTSKDKYRCSIKDKDRCCIKGMTLLTPDLLIITDYFNKAVKMVETSSQSVSDQLQLDDKPWDITRLTSSELAVTLPDKQTIQFISISSNQLRKKHTVKVDWKCHGISCYQGKLVVTFLYSAKIQILDMNGTILTTIDGKNDLKSPEYITCNRSSIYVSNWGRKTVTRLNWQGDVIGRYSGMGNPRGMSLSGDGTVFVCDWSRNVIEEISGDCSTGKVVLQDLKRPRDVCWCGEAKKLYYSCYSWGEKYGNYLHIYNMS